MNKQPFHPIRDGAGSFKISNPDDETPIMYMFTANDEFFVITEECTYRIQMADEIDPERQNLSLPPNFQQKLFSHGIKSELLCRTLLQAKIMFRKEFQSIDIDKAMKLSFEALGDLVSIDEATQNFGTTEQAVIAKVEKLESNDASITVPAVGNVRGACKSFSQKADHFAQSLMGLVRLFYPEMKKKNWVDFKELIKSRYGEGDNFYKVLESAAPFLTLIRDTRDCLEHKNLKGVKTKDFEPQTDGSIAPPTIEMHFRESSFDRCSISDFMEFVTKEMQDCFEMIVVHMCSKSVKPFAGMQSSVGILSDDQQKDWHVRFAYGAFYQDGHFIPCG